MASISQPRRSRRHQPNAQIKPETNRKFVWVGECHTRPARVHQDLFSDELEAWEAVEEPDRPQLQTRLFPQLEISSPRSRDSQTYSVGDTVLISASRKEPSVAVIVSMWETINPDETGTDPLKKLRIHWFVRPAELPAYRAKRDHAQNEIYYTLSRNDIIPPNAVISFCTVQGQIGRDVVLKSAQAWSVSPSKARKKYKYVGSDSDEEETDKGNATFICHLAVDTQRGLHYDFSWDDTRRQAISQQHLSDLDPEQAWIVHPEGSKSIRGRKKRSSTPDVATDSASSGSSAELSDSHSSGSDPEDYPDPSSSEDDLPRSSAGEPDEDVVPHTPRKRKRATNTTSSPRKSTKRTTAKPTPHSKAALRNRRKSQSKKKRTITLKASSNDTMPLPDLSHLPEDPWIRAMHVLHVGSNPLLSNSPGSDHARALPCRDAEYNRILGCVSDMLEEGSGGCIYISGVPGTGKTATVHAIVRQLKQLAQNNEISPFAYVEINGLRLPEPSAAYAPLWEAVSGHDAANEGHLRISSREALKELSRHFSGSGGRSRGPSGHACLVLMDELDQMVTTKQDVIYHFFNWPTLVDSKLVVIAVANTMDLPERHLNARVRSRLGMTRINFQPYVHNQLRTIIDARLASSSATLTEQKDKEQVVIAPDAIRLACMKVASISGDARRVLDVCRRAVELVHSKKRTVQAPDIQNIMKVMQNSPTAAFIRECSLHEQILLASVIKCMKRLGVEEVRWCEVEDQHNNYTQSLPSSSESHRRLSTAELTSVLESLVASRALLVEEGAAVSRKAKGERRVVLNLEQGEIERVLSEKHSNWRNIFHS